MPQNPLAALLAVQNLQQRNAPQVNLLDQQQGRLDEMLHNLEMAKGNPNMAVGATPSDVIGLQSDITDDPYTGDEQRALEAYNRPEQVQARETAKQDALAKLLLPIQARNEGDLAVEKIRGQSQIEAAQAAAGQRAATAQQSQQGQMARSQATAQNAYQRGQNASLEKQATAREKQGGYDIWNSLLGRQTNAQADAAKIRSGIVAPGGLAESSDDPASVAAQLFAQDPAGAAKLPAYLASHGASPEEVAAIVSAYQQLGGH